MNRKLLLLLLACFFVAGTTLTLAVPAQAKKKAFAEDEDMDEAPAKKKKAVEEDEEEVRPAKKKKAVEEDEEEAAPRRRRRAAADEEDVAPRKKDKVKAVGFGFDLHGGYTRLSMDDLNGDFRDYVNSSSESYSELHNGGYVGLDLNLTFLNSILAVGPRIQYIFGFPGTYKNDWSSGSNYSRTTIDNYVQMFPLMFGVQARTPGTVSVQGGLNLGYAWAWWQQVYKYEYKSGSYSTSSSGTVSYAGSTPMMEARLGVRFGKRFHLLLDSGYRLAKVMEMKATADNSDNGVKSGDVAKRWVGGSSRNLELDYSGWDLGARLGFDF
jgi:hypothetical protein